MAKDEMRTGTSEARDAASSMLVPEADAQEQQAPWLSDDSELPAVGPAASVPEADWLEQAEGGASAKSTPQSVFKLRSEIPEADYEEQMMSADEDAPDED